MDTAGILQVSVRLTENGFMDCLESLESLLCDEGKAAIVQLHVEGIIDYVRSCSEE